MKFSTVIILIAVAFIIGATEARWHWIVRISRALWAKWRRPKT